MKILLAFIGFLYFGAALAHHNPDHIDIDIDITIDNPPDPQPVDTDGGMSLDLLDGVSSSDLLSATTAAIAAGSHQFDYTTTRWQLSLTGVVELDETEDNYSIAVGKRFGQESFLPNSLFHASWTPEGDNDFVGFGVTILLGE